MVTNITMPTATPPAASTAPVSAIPTVPASAIPTAPTPVLAIFIAPILVGPSMFFFLLSPSSFLQYKFIHLAHTTFHAPYQVQFSLLLFSLRLAAVLPQFQTLRMRPQPSSLALISLRLMTLILQTSEVLGLPISLPWLQSS